MGLLGRTCYAIPYKDIAAVVSLIPYKEPEPNIENIMAHEKVVHAAREHGTTLPVKFGVIFRTEDGVRTLLSSSYAGYRAKLDRFRDTDEFGVKVLLKNQGLQKLRENVAKNSKSISRMQSQVSKAKQGKSYFLKMKLDEAIRAESFKKIDELSSQIHEELSKGVEQNVLLKLEHEQIILNAAYLVRKKDGEEFTKHARKLGQQYSPLGLIIHTSGPWAPYSFVEDEKKR